MARISMGTVAGLVLAVFIAALIFLEAGQFSRELKKIGYGLLWYGVIIVGIVIAVLVVREYTKKT